MQWSTVKQLIIGDDLFGESDELKKLSKNCRLQIKTFLSFDIPVLEITKLIIRQIAIFEKPPIVNEYSRFTVCVYYPGCPSRRKRFRNLFGIMKTQLVRILKMSVQDGKIQGIWFLKYCGYGVNNMYIKEFPQNTGFTVLGTKALNSIIASSMCSRMMISLPLSPVAAKTPIKHPGEFNPFVRPLYLSVGFPWSFVYDGT